MKKLDPCGWAAFLLASFTGACAPREVLRKEWKAAVSGSLGSLCVFKVTEYGKSVVRFFSFDPVKGTYKELLFPGPYPPPVPLAVGERAVPPACSLDISGLETASAMNLPVSPVFTWLLGGLYSLGEAVAKFIGNLISGGAWEALENVAKGISFLFLGGGEVRADYKRTYAPAVAYMACKNMGLEVEFMKDPASCIARIGAEAVDERKNEWMDCAWAGRELLKLSALLASRLF